MKYNRCGRFGLMLPAVSLGIWHNFGTDDPFDNCRDMIHTAFDLGITHIDIANNYGPPPGSAEITFSQILKKDFKSHRDEMVISTKAGYLMWPGPYGEWGSKKYLVASLDQSLQRLGLDYVDIFYSHRFDPKTPLEETMGALDWIVRQGKALYAGISNYDDKQTDKAVKILNELGTPCLIHQVKYSMFKREPEEKLFKVLEDNGVGCIAFSPLAQGLLTDRYLKGIPEDSRIAKSGTFLKEEDLTKATLKQIQALNDIAKDRGQSLAQMALSWVLRDSRVTSVLIGASRPRQIVQNTLCIDNTDFSKEELKKIDDILKEN